MVALLCFLIICLAMDVWEAKEIQNIKKEKRPDQNKAVWKFYCECSFFFLFFFIFSK